MAKSDFDKLTKEDEALIAEWFEGAHYKVFKKVLTLRRDSLAGQLLTTYNDKQVPHIQGKAEGQKELHEFFKTVNKQYRKKQEEERERKMAKKK